MTHYRLDSVLGLWWRGGRETVLASLWISATHIHRIDALLLPVESSVAKWRYVSHGIEYMAMFKTGGNFKSNTGYFYINFEYETHPNFGGNFSKKKVRFIVCKIQYTLNCSLMYFRGTIIKGFTGNCCDMMRGTVVYADIVPMSNCHQKWDFVEHIVNRVVVGYQQVWYVQEWWLL